MTDDLRNDIIGDLKERGITASLSGENLIITVCINDIDIILKCVFGAAFPYVFPKIYLTAESREKLDAMPHINTDNSICVYD